MQQRRRDFLGSAGAALGVALAGRGLRAATPPATITLLHHNDTYEIAPRKGVGGYAPFMTLLKAERARNPDSVCTFAGDLLSPSIQSGITKGRQMIELENAIGTQVAVPGNHEFDFGPAVAAERIGASAFPWLGTNVLGPDGRPAAGCLDWTMREVAGFKLGFLGLLTPATAELSKPGDAITFAPVIAAASAAVAELRRRGADLVVALTHLDIAEDRALAATVKDIDIVLGGHDHEPITFYENGKLILKAGSDMQYLAAIDVAIARVEAKDRPAIAWRPAWRFVPAAGVEADAATAAVVQGWTDQLDAELARPVGVLAVDLDSRRETVRTREAAIGDLVADAMRLSTGADCALTNGGGLRGDRTYEPGHELTRRDVLTELPFGNLTVVTELSGADIAAALENGVSQVADRAGRFPQVSGLAFSWDGRKPPGGRVSAVTLAGAPLDPARTYRLATNDYMLAGGDGYASLGRGRVVVDPSGATLMASTVINYVTALGGSVAVRPDGRIVRLDG